MPRNGNGTAVGAASSFNPAVPGTVIEAGAAGWETTYADLLSMLSQSVSRDGQTPITADIPFGTHKLTEVAPGAASTDAATVGQIQSSASQVGTVGGTADVITLTVSPAISAYAAGQEFFFVATGTNTTAVTVAVSGLAAKAIQANSVALVAGDIVSGRTYVIRYDGTQFQLFSSRAAVSHTADIAAGVLARNVLINGGMQVNQRVVTTGAADDTYINDRWNLLTQTSTVTISQLSNVTNGVPSAVRITQAQATAQRFGIEQIVESVNCRDLRGQTVALNAWVQCSASTNLKYAILEWTGTADTVTSDVVLSWTSGTYTPSNFFLAANLTVTAVGTMAVTAATPVILTTLTGTLGSSTNNLILFIWTETAQAQNVTLDVSKVQCQLGSTLGDFIWPDFGTEVLQCQRYYQKSFSLVIAPAQGTGLSTPFGNAQVVGASTVCNDGLGTVLPVVRRTLTGANITLYNPASANAQAYNYTTTTDCSATSVTKSMNTGFRVTFTSPGGSAAGNSIGVHYSIDDEL